MEAESSPLQNTKSLIREYYRDRDLLVTDVHRREIAFQHQGQIGPDDRHNSYQSLKELLERAHRAAPLGIFPLLLTIWIQTKESSKRKQ